MGEMVEFSMNGTESAGYLALPESGKGAAVLVLQEWWGLVDHIKDVADRLAAQGYVALAPDLYHGKSTTDPDVAGKEMMGLDITRAGRDLQGAVDFLVGHDAVTSDKVGAVGFCMGGKLALFAGGGHASIYAIANFYGVHPDVKPDFSKMKASVQCHFGKSDGFVPTADAEALVAEMKEAGVAVDAHFYDAGHAFFNDTREGAYDATSAKSAWERTLAFFGENLN